MTMVMANISSTPVVINPVKTMGYFNNTPLRLVAAPPMQSLANIKTPHQLNSDFNISGTGVGGYIAGQVLEKGVPVSRRVMCYHRRTGSLIAKTWSSEEGNFRFDGLEPGIGLFLTSVNDMGLTIPFNAVTNDLVVSRYIFDMDEIEGVGL